MSDFGRHAVHGFISRFVCLWTDIDQIETENYIGARIGPHVPKKSGAEEHGAGERRD